MSNIIKKTTKKPTKKVVGEVKVLHGAPIPRVKKNVAKKPRKTSARNNFNKIAVNATQVCHDECMPYPPLPTTIIKMEPPLDIPDVATEDVVELVKECEYEKPPEMILPYTYFIGIYKYISIGFTTREIIPVIVIHHIGECSIVLCAAEWFALISYISEIEDVFYNCSFMETKYLSNDTTIFYDVKFGQIIIKNKGVLKFTKADWECIVNMADFLKSVMNFYIQNVHSVKTYYNTYMQICKENNFTYLAPINFFPPANDSKTCNFTRLFYEIGFLCKKIKKPL